MDIKNIDNFKKFFDKDGLSKVKDLRVYKDIDNNYTFANHKQVFYPSPYIKSILDLLLKHNSNWEASIKVISSEQRIKRLCIFGVSFHSVVIKAFQDRKIVKSRFALPDPKLYEGNGLVSDLIIHVTPSFDDSGERKLQLESWTPVGNEGEVFYVHAYFLPDKHYFSHLDGAEMLFSPEQVEKLVRNGKKTRALKYEKQFRMDGKITEEEAYNVVRLFLPVEEIIICEYFEAKENVIYCV